MLRRTTDNQLRIKVGTHYKRIWLIIGQIFSSKSDSAKASRIMLPDFLVVGAMFRSDFTLPDVLESDWMHPDLRFRILNTNIWIFIWIFYHLSVKILLCVVNTENTKHAHTVLFHMTSCNVQLGTKLTGDSTINK